jgi:hypothetical protein
MDTQFPARCKCPTRAAGKSLQRFIPAYFQHTTFFFLAATAFDDNDVQGMYKSRAAELGLEPAASASRLVLPEARVWRTFKCARATSF